MDGFLALLAFITPQWALGMEMGLLSFQQELSGPQLVQCLLKVGLI